jgi:hypothetical protein
VNAAEPGQGCVADPDCPRPAPPGRRCWHHAAEKDELKSTETGRRLRLTEPLIVRAGPGALDWAQCRKALACDP